MGNETRQAARHSPRVPGLHGGLGRSGSVRPPSKSTAAVTPLTKAIPKTGERLPVIGMGSWLTFSVCDDKSAREVRVQVLRAFFEAGGGTIDSSPLYGTSEKVIG